MKSSPSIKSTCGNNFISEIDSCSKFKQPYNGASYCLKHPSPQPGTETDTNEVFK